MPTAAPLPANLTVTWIHDAGEFAMLEAEWNALFAAADNPTSPFHTFTWITQCWQAPGNAIRIALIRTPDRSLVAGFVFTCDLDTGMAPLVPVRMLAMVPHISNAHPANLIYLIQDGYRDHLPLVAMLRQLAQSWHWHAAFINFLTPEKDFLRNAFEQLAREFNWRITTGSSSTDAWINIENGRDAYMAQRSAKFRQNQRRARKALADMGTLRFREAHQCGDSWPDAEKHLLSGFTRCWQADSIASPMHPRNRAAMLSACHAMYRHGHMQLFFIELDSRPIAFEFGFSDATVYYPVVRGMDPDFARHSPGNLLAEESIHFFHQRGVKGIYLGPIQMSQQTRYKSHWLTDELTVPNMMIIPPGTWYARLNACYQNSKLFRKVWWRLRIGERARNRITSRNH